MGEAATLLNPQKETLIESLSAHDGISVPRTTLELVAHLPSISGTTQSGVATDKSKLVISLVTLLIILQLLDGILTGLGVSSHGIHLEANPILRTSMMQIGPLWTLLVAKGLAIAIICVLGRLAKSVRWLPPVMMVVAGIYFFAAIIPWTVILSSHIL